MSNFVFQSTLSVRRATIRFNRSLGRSIFQSTLSVRRATFCEQFHYNIWRISIHALRKESDDDGVRQLSFLVISIHALRKESDFHIPGGHIVDSISIHALRKESDHRLWFLSQIEIDFNPRSP